MSSHHRRLCRCTIVLVYDLYFSECSVYILASFVLFQTAVMVWYMFPFTEQVIMDTEHQQNGTKRKPNIEQLLPADKRHKPMEMDCLLYTSDAADE